jgi:hypothetical protein
MTKARLLLLIQHRLDESRLPTAPVYFDVDQTLILWNLSYTAYKPNQPVIDALKFMHSTGLVEIVLWSAAGRQHCIDVAQEFGFDHLVSAYLTKPAFCVDDLQILCKFTDHIYPENINEDCI